MNQSERELEVKFWVLDLPGLSKRLVEIGAVLDKPRVHETNLRFDTPDRSLSRDHQVLRLRQDSRARLTFKGPGSMDEGIHNRQEIEITVDHFLAARHFLEALGYQVIWTYEKYRTTYTAQGVEITLDETPLGDFAEIEGPAPASIKQMCEALSLNWEARLLDSYAGLFERARTTLALDATDLVFEQFAGVHAPMHALGLRPADRSST
jgi:adenylate cyclase, class 2